MTRRELLLAATAASVCSAAQQMSALAVEGYIFQQYAQSLKRPLQDVIGQVLPMARAAGFKNIELNPAFFAPEMRERILSLLRSQGLLMPSLYVGGPMHKKDGADRTIATALELGHLCTPFGCRAIVNNPDPKPGEASKTDAELGVQADSLNRMGRTLAQNGFDLRVHHHTPQLAENAREWRHILHHTDPEYVHICVDVDWAYEGGFEPIPFMREVGKRLREIHVRSAKNKLWLEDLEDSDIDYRKVADYLKEEGLAPLIVLELAYRPNTVVTRSLEEDLRVSRIYAERIFGVKANA
jgi:sugar phosphate isomerase/epimerase